MACLGDVSGVTNPEAKQVNKSLINNLDIVLEDENNEDDDDDDKEEENGNHDNNK